MKAKFLFFINIFLFALALWGYPLTALFVSNSNESQLLTIPYRAVVLLSSFLIIVFSIPNIRKSKKGSVIFKVLFLFLFIYSLRLVMDVTDNSISTWRSGGDYIISWFLICLFPGFAFLRILYDKNNGKIYLLVSLFCLILSLGLAYFKQNVIASSLMENGRLAFSAINPISVAYMGSSTIILSIYLYFQSKMKNVAFLLALLVAILLGIYFLIFAASRGPFISLVFTLIIFILSKISSNNWKNSFALDFFKIKSIFILIVITIGIINLIRISTDSGIRLERFSEYSEITDSPGNNLESRRGLVFLAIKSLEEGLNFIFGYGLEFPNGVGYPHNLIAESFLATGIIGGFLFLIVYSFAFIQSVKLAKLNNSTWQWLGLIYIQYAVGSLFSGALYTFYIFWYLLFAIFGLYRSGIITNSSVKKSRKKIELLGSYEKNSIF